MASTHRYPGIIPGRGKAEENAGIGLLTGLAPFTAQNEVRKCPVRVPPEAHAANAGGNAVFQGEVARPALGPSIGCRLAEKWLEPCLILRFGWNILSQVGGNRVNGPGLQPSVVKFSGFGLELDFSVIKALFGAVFFEARVCDYEDDLFV